MLAIAGGAFWAFRASLASDAHWPVFAVRGQTLVLATAASDRSGASKVFGAGTALWAAALLIVSSERYAPTLIRMVGILAAALFAGTAAQILRGVPLDALSKPLRFFAYPALVATLLGWAWTLWRETPK